VVAFTHTLLRSASENTRSVLQAQRGNAQRCVCVNGP